MGSAITIVIGFIVTFLPQFLLGNYGMPRRYYEYPEEFQTLNVLSTMGAILLFVGFVMVALYLGHALRYGKIANDNPWGSKGYEWTTTSPPPTHNFVGPQPVFPEEPHLYISKTDREDPHAV